MSKPAFYSPELAAEICDRIALGGSVRSVCEGEDMPSREAVRRWLKEREDFRASYADALKERTDAMAEDILAIADDPTLDPQDKKVRMGARQWLMAKMAPKKYGDRVEVTGDPDRPVISPDPNDMARRVAFMLAGGAAQRDRPE